MGNDTSVKNPDAARIFAEISQAYVEILVGVRRPEQLARWLSDKIYYDVCQKAKREARQRQMQGVAIRPEIVVKRSQTFLTDFDAYEGVVLLRVSGATRAISLRAEYIHERFRVTALQLI
ncbi:MAG: hypothetical protein RL418_563 [Actinomycetota bacterium]|jgi:hypothetical protein